jgi:hypothetical protein
VPALCSVLFIRYSAETTIDEWRQSGRAPGGRAKIISWSSTLTPASGTYCRKDIPPLLTLWRRYLKFTVNDFPSRGCSPDFHAGIYSIDITELIARNNEPHRLRQSICPRYRTRLPPPLPPPRFTGPPCTEIKSSGRRGWGLDCHAQAMQKTINLVVRYGRLATVAVGVNIDGTRDNAPDLNCRCAEGIASSDFKKGDSLNQNKVQWQGKSL